MKTAQEIREAAFDGLVRALVWLGVCYAAWHVCTLLAAHVGLARYWAIVPVVAIGMVSHHFFKRVLK